MRGSRARTLDPEAVACDTNDGWILGNILFDRDVYGDGDHGDFGVSLSAAALPSA